MEAKQKEMLKEIPVEFHSVLAWMAYDRGHSAGEEEVLSILGSLVDDLKPAIDNFKKRMKELEEALAVCKGDYDNLARVASKAGLTLLSEDSHKKAETLHAILNKKQEIQHKID